MRRFLLSIGLLTHISGIALLVIASIAATLAITRANSELPLWQYRRGERFADALLLDGGRWSVAFGTKRAQPGVDARLVGGSIFQIGDSGGAFRILTFRSEGREGVLDDGRPRIEGLTVAGHTATVAAVGMVVSAIPLLFPVFRRRALWCYSSAFHRVINLLTRRKRRNRGAGFDVVPDAKAPRT